MQNVNPDNALEQTAANTGSPVTNNHGVRVSLRTNEQLPSLFDGLSVPAREVAAELVGHLFSGYVLLGGPEELAARERLVELLGPQEGERLFGRIMDQVVIHRRGWELSYGTQRGGSQRCEVCE